MIKRLSNKEVKEISLKINEINKKDVVDIVDEKFLKINNEFRYFKFDNKWIPTLKYIHSNPCNLKKVVVDFGAIKFVTNGADIMRPGITQFDENIEKNEIIQIVEEKHNKTIAIGRALNNSHEMKKQEKGKVIENIHYIGDEIWNI